MAQTPAFEAFEPSVVVDEFARKIEALCVWRETILASLADGSLLFFDQVAAAAGGAPSPPSTTTSASSAAAGTVQQQQQQAPGIETWQVTRVHKGFTKRGGALQLQALEAQACLLCLSDDGVQLHSLPDCVQVSAASRTSKGAAFSWDEGRQLLATATKKKVLTHQLDRQHNSLQEMTEYQLPDPVLALSWVGASIIAATAKAYWLIVPAPPQTVEVLPGQPMTIYPTVAPQQLFGASSGQPPLITRVGAEEVLVSRDAVSYFLGPDGKPSRKASITWSQPPRVLLSNGLYALGLLPSAVEVRGVGRGAAPAAAQMLLLPNMAVAAPAPAADGCLYIASGADGGIRQLRPLPLERQAKLLAAAGDFQGALELLTVLEDDETAAAAAAAAAADGASGGGSSSNCGGRAAAAAAAPAASSRRQQMEDMLRLRFGFHLFESGECDEALTQLSMTSDPDPLLLLVLYPHLVPDKFRPLLPTSAFGEPLPALQSSSGSSDSAAGKAEQERAARQQAAAVAVVVPYLLSHRTRLLSSLEAQQEQEAGGAAAEENGGGKAHRTPSAGGSSGGSSASGGGSSAGLASTPQQQRSTQELRLLASVIDSAILRAMLLQPDSGALLRLLQQPNYVDLDNGEAVLTAAGRYAELAALLQYHARHADGLALLRALSQSPASLPVAPTGAAGDLAGLPGVWAAVRYLVAVQPQDLALLQEHAGWILAADPEAGLEALLAMRPPLDFKLVLPILEAHAPSYTAVYLESALELAQVSPQEVHSELLLIYLHLALEEEREGEASCEAHARQLSLSDLLVSRPPVPLKLFPDDASLWTAAPAKARQQQQQKQAAAAAAAAAAKEKAALAAGSPVRSKQQRGGGATAAAAAVADDDSSSSSSKSSVDGGSAGDGALISTGNAAGAGGGSSTPRYNATTLAAPHHPHHRRDAYQRLRELVYASPHINPDYVLSKLGQGHLLEIRALMLERLGRHREALSVYVHDLSSMALAEQYCDRVYDAGLAAAAAKGGKGGGGGAAATAAAARVAGGAGEAGDGGDALQQLPPPPPPVNLPGGWGGGGARAVAGADGAADSSGGPKWGKVQVARPQQQQQQQQEKPQAGGRRGLAGPGARSWSALPFGAKPQDIYMELVDAVLQGPLAQRSASGLPSPAAADAGSTKGKGKGGKQKQQQQQEQPAAAAPAAAWKPDRQAWKQLSELLARKSDRINHLQVLDVLPADLPLSDAASLLSGMLLHNTETARNTGVVLHLRRGENLMAREELVRVKQRVVTLTFDRACCICHKRMGGAVSVAYPNGSLAHYLCYKRSVQQQQQLGPGGSSSPAAAAAGGGGPAWGAGGLPAGLLPPASGAAGSQPAAALAAVAH